MSLAAGGRLRVLQVTHDLGIGGLPRVVVTLARTLDRGRFDVSVLCMNETGPLADELARAGIPVLRVPSPRQPDRLAALRVARLLRREKVDVLHTHNTQPFLEAGLAGWLTRVPRHIHTDHGRAFPDRRRYMWAERFMSRFTDRIVGVSKETSEQLVRWERIDPARVVTIENGIDGTPFAEAPGRAATRASLGIADDAPLIGTVARLQPEKGVDVLIDAVPEIARERPGAVCLVIGYGDEEARLRARAEAREAAGRVRFLGARRDVPALLKALDCYALPSRREGLPMAVLEAMAAGCPIVATRVGGVPSALVDGKSATLVPPEDPRALARAVVELLADPGRARRYAEEAGRTFAERFSAAAMTRRYEALYLGEDE